MTPRQMVVLLLPATLCLAWMNPTRDRIIEGNALLKKGKYEESIERYGEVLVDDPESPLLNFNMGVANFKAGKYSEAVASFSRVRPSDDDLSRTARAAYNTGNAEYRIGAAAENDKPQEAIAAYGRALVAYRRAIVLDPEDKDAKFNYEFVAKKIDDLKRKLEEQQQQQDQQRDQNQDQQPQDQQQPPDQQQADKQEQPAQEAPNDPGEQQGGEQQSDQAQQPPQAPQENQPDEDSQAAAEPQGEQSANPAAEKPAVQGSASDEPHDRMSPQEAAALVDTARNDELQPGEFARRQQGAAVAEPAQDW